MIYPKIDEGLTLKSSHAKLWFAPGAGRKEHRLDQRAENRVVDPANPGVLDIGRRDSWRPRDRRWRTSETTEVARIPIDTNRRCSGSIGDRWHLALFNMVQTQTTRQRLGRTVEGVGAAFCSTFGSTSRPTLSNHGSNIL